MTIVEVVSVIAHIASLTACVRFLMQGNNRNEDIAVLAGIAFSSVTFVVMQVMRGLALNGHITIQDSAHHSLVGGFFMLNGMIFLCVAISLQRHKSRRTGL